MHLISESITYIFLFIALYLEVFLLINYFELKEATSILATAGEGKKRLPSVSIIVPVWNEETTVLKTIFSILRMNYPKDKLQVLVVDDGSTDKTWNVLQRFVHNKQVKLLRKENGGKHTALNYALEHVNSELVGCLDADSFAHPEALRRIVAHFLDPKMMAVTPSIKLHEPKGILQLVQKSEYIFGIFLRKVFAHIDAIYITPGPLSIFRRSVFHKIGNYRHAHNTEDMEMAMRMQKHGMKIGNAHDAFVYTVGPKNLRALYKQRLRWVYGFIKNAIDYRDMFFRPQYGHLGMVVLPAAGFSVFSTLYFFGATVAGWIGTLWTAMSRFLTVGLWRPDFNFDVFYINTDIVAIISFMAILGTLFIIINSRRIAGEKYKIGLDSMLLGLYVLIAPFWMTKAIYNVVFAQKTKWR